MRERERERRIFFEVAALTDPVASQLGQEVTFRFAGKSLDILQIPTLKLIEWVKANIFVGYQDVTCINYLFTVVAESRHLIKKRNTVNNVWPCLLWTNRTRRAVIAFGFGSFQNLPDIVILPLAQLHNYLCSRMLRLNTRSWRGREETEKGGKKETKAAKISKSESSGRFELNLEAKEEDDQDQVEMEFQGTPPACCCCVLILLGARLYDTHALSLSASSPAAAIFL